MTASRKASAPHPRDALFPGEKAIPAIAACEHFAGSEKLIVKALELQAKMGRIFDITCDCEDGAEAGREKQHAEMIVENLTSSRNTFGMAGARIHDYTHPHWKKDVDILVGGAGKVLAYGRFKCTERRAGRRDDGLHPGRREAQEARRDSRARADRDPRRPLRARGTSRRSSTCRCSTSGSWIS
jgi:hypothetical protein